jgi:hypothetical protein
MDKLATLIDVALAAHGGTAWKVFVRRMPDARQGKTVVYKTIERRLQRYIERNNLPRLGRSAGKKK